jgi:hypothetical protein
VLLPLANGHSTNARVTQVWVCQCMYMSTHVYIGTRLAYGFSKATARLYQHLFMSTLGYINYQNINVLFIAALLYINFQYQSSKLVLRIWTIFSDQIRIQQQVVWCWQQQSILSRWFCSSHQHIHYDVKKSTCWELLRLGNEPHTACYDTTTHWLLGYVRSPVECCW